jgi:hypothetical protein
MTKSQRAKLKKATTILTEYVANNSIDSIGKEVEPVRKLLIEMEEEEKKCDTWHTRKYSLVKE